MIFFLNLPCFFSTLSTLFALWLLGGTKDSCAGTLPLIDLKSSSLWPWRIFEKCYLRFGTHWISDLSLLAKLPTPQAFFLFLWLGESAFCFFLSIGTSCDRLRFTWLVMLVLIFCWFKGWILIHKNQKSYFPWASSRFFFFFSNIASQVFSWVLGFKKTISFYFKVRVIVRLYTFVALLCHSRIKNLSWGLKQRSQILWMSASSLVLDRDISWGRASLPSL